MSTKSERPNILLITSDQQRHDTLGCTNPRIRTPNLDRMVNNGVRFSRAYCANPYCTPSRATILNGQHPSQHGAFCIGTVLDEETCRPTLPEILGNNGYHTALIGKAHFRPTGEKGEKALEGERLHDYDFWKSFHGPWYGFDYIEHTRPHGDERLVGSHYALWLMEKGVDVYRHFRETPKDKGQRGRWSLPEEFHSDAWITELTNRYLEEQADEDEPFYCWASYFDPHPPYLVPEPWDSMYAPEDMEIQFHVEGEHEARSPHWTEAFERRWGEGEFEDVRWPGAHQQRDFPEAEYRKQLAVYYGMVSMLDKYVGKVLDKLAETGQAHNTLVVFTTDHGHFCGHHGLSGKGPFHLEGLIRIPWLACWPGRIPEGRVFDSLLGHVDFPPTILDAAGIESPPQFQGVSQLPVWTGKADSVRDCVLVEDRCQQTKFYAQTLVTGRHKITVYTQHESGELYDLEKDPKEIRNFWHDPEYRDIRTELLQRMCRLHMQTEVVTRRRLSFA